jgi:hypothetical protein
MPNIVTVSRFRWFKDIIWDKVELREDNRVVSSDSGDMTPQVELDCTMQDGKVYYACMQVNGINHMILTNGKEEWQYTARYLYIGTNLQRQFLWGVCGGAAQTIDVPALPKDEQILEIIFDLREEPMVFFMSDGKSYGSCPCIKGPLTVAFRMRNYAELFKDEIPQETWEAYQNKEPYIASTKENRDPYVIDPAKTIYF